MSLLLNNLRGKAISDAIRSYKELVYKPKIESIITPWVFISNVVHTINWFDLLKYFSAINTGKKFVFPLIPHGMYKDDKIYLIKVGVYLIESLKILDAITTTVNARYRNITKEEKAFYIDVLELFRFEYLLYIEKEDKTETLDERGERGPLSLTREKINWDDKKYCKNYIRIIQGNNPYINIYYQFMEKIKLFENVLPCDIGLIDSYLTDKTFNNRSLDENILDDPPAPKKQTRSVTRDIYSKIYYTKGDRKWIVNNAISFNVMNTLKDFHKSFLSNTQNTIDNLYSLIVNEFIHNPHPIGIMVVLYMKNFIGIFKSLKNNNEPIKCGEDYERIIQANKRLGEFLGLVLYQLFNLKYLVSETITLPIGAIIQRDFEKKKWPTRVIYNDDGLYYYLTNDEQGKPKDMKVIWKNSDSFKLLQFVSEEDLPERLKEMINSENVCNSYCFATYKRSTITGIIKMTLEQRTSTIVNLYYFNFKQVDVVLSNVTSIIKGLIINSVPVPSYYKRSKGSTTELREKFWILNSFKSGLDLWDMNTRSAIEEIFNQDKIELYIDSYGWN